MAFIKINNIRIRTEDNLSVKAQAKFWYVNSDFLFAWVVFQE